MAFGHMVPHRWRGPDCHVRIGESGLLWTLCGWPFGAESVAEGT